MTTYHPSDVLLKNDICLNTICKYALAQAACSRHKNLAAAAESLWLLHATLTVKDCCMATGRGRGVMGVFGLCRVSESAFFFYVLCAD
jgi:hypothetical protein